MNNNDSGLLSKNSIGQLLVSLSVPATAGMIAGALNNIMDAFYIGRVVGVDALAGITVVFPVFLFVSACGQGIGMGGAVLLSMSLGKGNLKKGEKYIGTILALSGVASLILLGVSWIFREPILKLLGASPHTLPWAREYFTFILPAWCLYIFSVTLSSAVRSEGKASRAMISVFIGVVLNIILDPLFLIVFKLGIKGAAIAATISFASSVAYLLFYFYSGKSIWKLHMYNISLKSTTVKEILHFGISSFARQIAGAFVNIVINNSIIKYGNYNTLAAFGIMNRIFSFLFMPLSGLAAGLQPILGFCTGAHDGIRSSRAIRISFIVATVYSTLSFLILLLFAPVLTSFFNSNHDLIKEGSRTIRFASMGFSFIGFQVIATVVFLAAGKGITSLFLTLTRQVIILIPLALILPLFFGRDGLWISFSISDAVSFVIAAILVKFEVKKISEMKPEFD
ncbi:MATE family efflux transporter [Myxococcota bacterium]|nr:MATE family efflux transporter [Myxococcota bacterium]MBU1380704.1 MATE family efflux transporter [Myxococcota bacterium]MBU1498815.1 MATE family efflux transporter [Myxococcota bacterium]